MGIAEIEKHTGSLLVLEKISFHLYIYPPDSQESDGVNENPKSSGLKFAKIHPTLQTYKFWGIPTAWEVSNGEG